MPATNLPMGGVPRTSTVAVAGTRVKLTRTRDNYNLRNGVCIQNAGAVDVFLGGPDVTATGAATGLLLVGGLSPPDQFADAVGDQDWYAITAGGSASVRVVELY